MTSKRCRSTDVRLGHLVYKPWVAAVSLIRDADILLFDEQAGSFESAEIGLLSMSTTSHVELAKWWGSMLCSVGMVDLGGRAIALEKHLRDGRTVHVYRVRANARQRALASKAILQGLLHNYSRGAIRRQIWLRQPVLRRLTRWLWPGEIQTARDDDANGGWHDMMCAEFVAKVWEAGEKDITPHMAPFAMQPINFAESAICRYQFTLRYPEG